MSFPRPASSLGVGPIRVTSPDPKTRFPNVGVDEQTVASGNSPWMIFTKSYMSLSSVRYPNGSPRAILVITSNDQYWAACAKSIGRTSFAVEMYFLSIKLTSEAISASILTPRSRFSFREYCLSFADLLADISRVAKQCSAYPGLHLNSQFVVLL